MHEVKKCPICSSSNLKNFITEDMVPVHQNYLFDDKISAINIKKASLSLVVCIECSFIFNQNFDISLLDYSDRYENIQDYSPIFNNYLSNLSDMLLFKKNIQNCKIVEVGCGKGTFLQKMVRNQQCNNIGFGFDPSYTGPDSDLDGRLKFFRKFYNSDNKIEADVIISRHVIEHVPDPISLLKSIRNALTSSTKSRVFFETPDVEWILRNLVIWDFFYEHCSYFNAQSITTAFEISGFRVVNIQRVFENQYLLVEAVVNDKIAITKNSNEIPLLVETFVKNRQKLIDYWTEKIQMLIKENHKIALWGAGAKGVTFANLIDKENNLIDSIIDINPKKQGKFVPGTGHQIIAPKEISKRDIDDVILMNPNYHKEVLDIIDKEKINLSLISK